jgi:hypothetical protein
MFLRFIHMPAQLSLFRDLIVIHLKFKACLGSCIVIDARSGALAANQSIIYSRNAQPRNTARRRLGIVSAITIWPECSLFNIEITNALGLHIYVRLKHFNSACKC